MPGRRHERADLEDYETRDSYDTLDDSPGDDPLDRGVVPPLGWSAGMRPGSATPELGRGESLEELLAEEEPNLSDDDDSWDENATEQDVYRLSAADGADPRSGRLVAEDEGSNVAGFTDDLFADDVGVDGGGASPEEAAIHVLPDDE
ncbi:MAG TPA: DUF5709 domain-containing protein [Streptosporangiaceae bacterium]|nr:DUF5709 domain-containing protein [Streptosporangiaceae bacterium]